MTKEQEATIHCLKVTADEEVCEECPLYGTVGTDHCQTDCARYAYRALEVISHLKDRPCSACEFHKENGCCKWDCVFDEVIRK